MQENIADLRLRGLCDANIDEFTEVINKIKEDKRVTYLNLSQNNIGPECAKVIADFLKTPDNGLVSLNLEYNLIGDEGIAAIALALKTNTTLVNLNVCCNRIKHAGALAVYHLFKDNDVVVVNMLYNKIRKMAPIIEKLSRYNRVHDETKLKWRWDYGAHNREFNLLMKERFWWSKHPLHFTYAECSFNYIECGYEDRKETISTIVRVPSAETQTYLDHYNGQRSLVDCIWEAFQEADLAHGVLYSDYYVGELGLASFEYEIIENPDSKVKQDTEFFMDKNFRVGKNRGFNKTKRNKIDFF